MDCTLIHLIKAENVNFEQLIIVVIVLILTLPDMVVNLTAGFSVTRETGNYNSQGGSSSGLGVSRLKSQLSFTGQDSLSQISEVSENGIDGVNSSSGHQNATHSYATTSFGMDSWENGNSIVFSAPSNKRTKTLDGDILDCLNALETQVLNHFQVLSRIIKIQGE